MNSNIMTIPRLAPSSFNLPTRTAKQETRVHMRIDDVASNIWQALP